MPYVTVDQDFFEHPKTRALVAELEGEGVANVELLPIRLWMYAIRFGKGGTVEMTGRQIEELVLQWSGTPGKAIKALRGTARKRRFIEPIRRGKAWKVISWDDHSGRYLRDLERRANAARDRRARVKDEEQEPDSSGTVPGTFPEHSGTVPGREDQTSLDQKRREETRPEGAEGRLDINRTGGVGRSEEAAPPEMYPASVLTTRTLGFLDSVEAMTMLDSQQTREQLAGHVAEAARADVKLAYVCLFIANRARKRSADPIRSVCGFVTKLLNDRKYPIPEVAWEDCQQAFSGKAS